MTFQPLVIYHKPGTDRSDCIIRYISNRVLKSNKNFLCALTGPTGVGKSWCAVALAEDLKEYNGIPFEPSKQIVSSVKQILQLVKDKKTTNDIENGSPIVFEEPQISANARNWHDESNKMLASLLSIFRSERLIVFFTTPFLEDIDKQSRKLFHAKFEVQSYDSKTKLTLIKPRFIEFSPYCASFDGFYRRMLINQYAIEGKHHYGMEKVNTIMVKAPSKDLTIQYESIKSQYNTQHYERMLNEMENSEKKKVKTDTREDYIKVKELYSIYKENYDILMQKLPHIGPRTLERYIILIKKSLNAPQQANQQSNLLAPDNNENNTTPQSI